MCVWGCLDKYISVATWPPKQKFLAPPLMSKHAVLGLVRSASLQVGSYGIRVNCVSPGVVGTPLVKDTMGLKNDEEVGKVQELSSYLKGGLIMPKNVADAVVFLASEDSQFVTGHNLVVDAGFKLKV